MKPLDYLKGALQDAVSDDCSSDDIIRAVRSGLGDQVAYHKRMADKAQKALDQLNKFGPADEPLYPASDTISFADPYVWGIHPPAAADTISFSASNDTISFGGDTVLR